MDRNRLLNAFDGVVISKGTPAVLMPAWLEHAKIKPRYTHRTLLQMSNRGYAYLFEEREHAKQVEYELSLRRIQKLGKRAGKDPVTNFELEPEKPLIMEND